MIDALRIRNFRSIADSGTLELSKLNVLVGPNNVGKSSLLAAILLVKQTLSDKDTSSTLVTSGPIIDLGSYLDIVNGKPESTKLCIEFKLSGQSLPVIPSQLFEGEETKTERRLYDRWRFEFLYDREDNRVNVAAFSMENSSTGAKVGGRARRDGNWSYRGIPKDIIPHISISFMHFIPTFEPGGPVPDEKTVNRVISFCTFSFLAAQLLSRTFERLSYVGPVREKIPRYGVLGTMPYSEIGPSGQNLMRVLSRRGPTGKKAKLPIEALNYWLYKRFRMLKNVHSWPLDRGGTVRALIADDCEGRKKINLAATGSGISQLVPIVVQTVLASRSGCLIVEQPEIHLHPATQTVLGDLFYENAERGAQYIVETHSEHMILRLRRRVAEGKLKPEDLRIFLVEKKQKQTKFRALELSSNGHFVEWPEGFLEEAYQEALAIVEAGQEGK